MLGMLQRQEYAAFIITLFVIIFSLTLHEFGHAASAKMLGDNTAEKMGRLNLNPLNHIDPIGLLAVIFISFGFAKPVPVNPRNFKTKWADAAVAAAGPFMNLMIAIVAINLLAYGVSNQIEVLSSSTAYTVLTTLTVINLILMLFNLLPIGPLDGHYIMEWLLPKSLKYKYHQLNSQYGSKFFLVLIVLSIIGLPIFSFLHTYSMKIANLLIFV